MSSIKNTAAPLPKVLLLGIQLPKVSPIEHQASLAELERLVNTLGYEVVGTISQKRSSSSSALVVGEGKLRELAEWTGGPGHVVPTVRKKKSKAAERFEGFLEEEVAEEETNDFGNETDDGDLVEDLDLEAAAHPPEGVRAGMIVFDGELTPSQLRNLESATGVEVLDRTGVIIEIFSRHARTRMARLQVEIARLKYLAPRLRETGGGGDRQGGGIGGKGSGESSQELDRRHIRDRIAELRVELSAVQAEGSVRRQRRSDENAVALVGYTNAGKSSLMRAMTGSQILVADKLFATLDTTVRPLDPPSVPRVLMSDTVGFIKKLPHDLVASFHSTLEEALNADLLLYVVDSSDPTFRQQLEVTRQVLGEIHAEDVDSLLILNKRDRLSAEEAESLRREFPDAIQLSTRSPDDLSELRETLLRFFESDMVDADLLIPFTVQGAIGEIRRQMRVLAETYSEKGVTLKVRAREADLNRLRARFKLPETP
ncbi:MAG: GTPase HflX [Bdellovibrionales bacterium]|nr:GTPase HflX [Bdellovibrionales bacterium]